MMMMRRFYNTTATAAADYASAAADYTTTIVITVLPFISCSKMTNHGARAIRVGIKLLLKE